jgi:homocysteine S-methyltransferase
MKKLLIGDGGMGSELRFRGVEVPSHTESIWSALALIENTADVKEIHLDYINAGAQFITANNYTVTRPILERANMGDRLEELTLLSLSIAKEAIEESGKDILLAASLPPLETSYRADLILDEIMMASQYDELAKILEGRCDIIICETMSHSTEAKIALSSIQNSNAEKWLSWTLHGNRCNTLPSGETIAEAFKQTSDLSCDAYLVNCCGANLVTESLKELKKLTNKPFGGYANSELIELSVDNTKEISAENNHWESAITIDEETYTSEVSKWIDEGASIIAGCCRTRPSHIKDMVSNFVD